MHTGKSFYKNEKRVKINTIKHLIVFILMFIFIIGVYTQNVYADKNNTDENSQNNKQELVKNNYTFEKKEDNLDVKIRCGINDATKVGSITALNILINNAGNVFEGYVQVGIPQSKEGTLYSEKISIGSNEEKNINIYVPVNVQTHELKFSIIDLEGNEYYKSDVNINTYSKGCYMIGVLADKPADLMYLLSNKDSRYYFYSKDTMPIDYKALDMLDMIFINNYNVSLLSEEQYVAIKEWVLQGGTLVIGTGTGAGTVLNRFSKDFITAKVSSVDEMDISFGTTSSDIEDSAELQGAETTWLKTNIATIDMEDAITIESASSRPIVQCINKGKGKVIVCGFNMQISAQYKDMQEKLSDMIFTYSSLESETMYMKFLKSILESAKGRTPNPVLYIGLLGVYVAVIIVVLILYSKKLNTQKIVKIIPIIAGSVCAVIGIMGIGTRINTMHSSHFSLINLEDNNIANVEKYFNITLPDIKERELELREKNHFYEISEGTGLGMVASGSLFNTEITRDGATTNLKLKGLAAFDTKTYESYGKYESNMNINAKINCWNNVYSGIVENKTGYDLDYIFLLTKSSVVYMGDIPKDEKLNKNSMKQSQYVSINELEQVIPKLLGKKNIDTSNSINSKGEITVSGITRILQYYMISSGVSSNNEGCLLAITKSKDKVFVNNNIKEEGISVLATSVPINYTSGNEKYIPNICKDNISFELGNYYYSTTTNTIQLMDSVVGEYIIDKTENIKSISFKENKDESINEGGFKGTVSMWNYTTNEYEEVYKTGQDVEVNDLTKFVSSSKVMKFKFKADEDSRGCTLPIISAIITM